MRRFILGLTTILAAAPLMSCGQSEQSQPPVTNIEEMGPSGGSNVTTTPMANSTTAPVGATGDGNVTPGDANPENPRPGTQPPSGQ